MKHRFLFDHGHGKQSGKTEEVTPLVGEVDGEKIKEWKAKHKDGIYVVKVGGHAAYFRNPNFDDMNCGYSKADIDTPLDTWMSIAETTFLGGSEEVLKDPKLFPGIMKNVQKKCAGAKAELEDL